MKQGMRTIEEKSINEKESIAICGNGHEWATYLRVDSNDYFGHYFKDYSDAYEDFHMRFKEVHI